MIWRFIWLTVCCATVCNCDHGWDKHRQVGEMVPWVSISDRMMQQQNGEQMSAAGGKDSVDVVMAVVELDRDVGDPSVVRRGQAW